MASKVSRSLVSHSQEQDLGAGDLIRMEIKDDGSFFEAYQRQILEKAGSSSKELPDSAQALEATPPPETADFYAEPSFQGVGTLL